MVKTRTAVIGCGAWGTQHARVYRELESTELMAVCDIDKAKARKVAERYGIDAYTDYGTILGRQDIEAVSICTPTVTHADVAISSIEAGKHVLIEKPMTNLVTEARKVMRAADKAGVKLMVGFVERFNPAVQKTVELVKAGEVGEIILAHTRRVSRRPERVGDVGIVKDLAIHDIDVVCQLFDSPVSEVYAVAGSIAHEFEDYADIIFRFKGGKSAFIEANWLTPRKVRRLIVTATEGLINVEYITQRISIEKQAEVKEPILEMKEPLKLMLESFSTAILNDKPPSPSGEDGLRALTLCEAVLLSADTRKPVRL